MKKWIFLSLTIVLWTSSDGQRMGGGGRSQNTIRYYGKVLNTVSGKAIDAAFVQLWVMPPDSFPVKKKEKMVRGVLSESNGDFVLDSVPVYPKYTLRVTALGFDTFSIALNGPVKPNSPGMLFSEKDLGNIRIRPNQRVLDEFVVKADEPAVKMGVDRKTYNMDKALIATGGTGLDAIRVVPNVNVDMDGNIQLRNATPQLFVDGRPTTLTLDQIPADIIQSIEVITNPSAKYDASGGMSGIINVVLKKNKRTGYNGSVRLGVDRRGMLNGGFDINVREKKVNLFAGTNLNQRKSISEGWSERENFFSSPVEKISQLNSSIQRGYMTNFRLGVDYLIDNRNTLTISTNFTAGGHTPTESQKTTNDSIGNADLNISYYSRSTDSYRHFRNWGNSILYKHIFPGTGKELTADINANLVRARGGADATTIYTDANKNVYRENAIQKQEYKGASSYYTSQVDYSNTLNEQTKIETGIRSAFRLFESENANSIYDPVSKVFNTIKAQQNNYSYYDWINAIYFNYNKQLNKWGYQLGLRAENSIYKGKLTGTNESYSIQYPISLFPSLSVLYRMKQNHELNLNLSRKINRPGFFQIMPYIDFSDSLNLSMGNPSLRPEFIYSAEFSYMFTYKNKQSLMANIYGKFIDGLITRYFTSMYDTVLDRTLVINTYQNALSSFAYGIELTSRNNYKKWLELTSSFNLFQSNINGGNIVAGLNNKQISWFAKMNATFKIYKVWNVQLMSEYLSKMGFQQGGDGGGGRMGGGMGMGGTQNSAQGYTLPSFSTDFAIKREFLKNKSLSVTLNFTDIFHTKRNYSFSSSSYFEMYNFRQRDWRMVRVVASWKFGKFDASLFRRKNNRSEQGEMM